MLIHQVEIVLGILSQFTGDRGGVDNNIVFYGISGTFFLILSAVARAEFNINANPREQLLLWGFGLGLARNIFMISMALLQALGFFNQVTLHEIFPPLEHALNELAMVVIAAGYMGYFVNKPQLVSRYLVASVVSTGLVYLTTFSWWAHYIAAHPSSKFGQTWCEYFYRGNAAIWLLLSAIFIFFQSKFRKRLTITFALVLFSASEFLKIPDSLLGEMYEHMFTPVARLSYLTAIFMLGYIYFQELFSQLHNSQENLLTMLESCPTAARIARVDTGRVIFYNSRYLSLTDSTAEECTYLNPARYYVDPDVYADIRTRLRRGEHIVDRLVELRKPHAPVSESKWVLASYLMMEFQGKSAMLAWFHEITEHIRTDRIKSEFLSTVNHELRTPLTAISGALGLISGGVLGELPPKAGQMLEVARANSLRLAHLINDLLDMEKLVSGKMNFDIKRQKLMPLLRQSIEANSTYDSEREVRLVLIDPVADVEIDVDDKRLLQILANFISNAIKYSANGASVEISLQADGTQVRLSVTDHGAGIPEQFRKRIFQKFAQADSSDARKKGGTGLGLAISREMAEGMGGRVGYDSAENQGSCFYVEFSLPAVNQNESS